MTRRLTFLSALLLVPWAPLSAGDPAAPVRELLRHDFTTVPQKPWLQPHGFWEAAEGFMRGKENPAEHHGASVKGFASFHDATFSYEVRFDGGRVHTLGINQPRAHLFHIDFNPGEMLIVKNPLDTDKSVKSEVLARAPLALEPGCWYAIRAEITGDSVRVKIGETQISAAHQNFSREKGSFNLYVNGDSISFRNFLLRTTEPAQKP
jgi:hypothetical protein